MDSTVSKTQIPERELTYRTLLGDAFISSSIVPILLYGSYLCSLFLSEPLPAFRGLALVFGVHVAVSMAEAGVAWCMLRYPQRVDGRQRVLFVVLTSLVLASPLSFLIFIPGEFFRGITLYLIVTLLISHVPVLFVERLRWREKKEAQVPLPATQTVAASPLSVPFTRLFLCGLFSSFILPLFLGGMEWTLFTKGERMFILAVVWLALSLLLACVAWLLLPYLRRASVLRKLFYVVSVWMVCAVLLLPLTPQLFSSVGRLPDWLPYGGLCLLLMPLLFLACAGRKWVEKPLRGHVRVLHAAERVAACGQLRIRRLPECAAAALLPWVGVAYPVIVVGLVGMRPDKVSTYLFSRIGGMLVGWVILSLILTAVVWGMQKNRTARILIPLFLAAVAVGVDCYFGMVMVVPCLLMPVPAGILTVVIQRMLSPQPGRKPCSELTCALLSVLPLISCGLPFWLLSFPSMLWTTVMCLFACGMAAVVLHAAGLSLLGNAGNAAWWRRILFVPLVCLLYVFPATLCMSPDYNAPLALAPVFAPVAILYILLRELNALKAAAE